MSKLYTGAEMVLRVFVPVALLLAPCMLFAAPQSSAGSVTVVHMTAKKQYSPKTVTITVGDSVEWVNDDPANIHNATTDKDATDLPKAIQLPQGAKPFNSGLMVAGKRYRYRFTVPGTYRYVCVPHQPEMVGTVIVKPKPTAGGEQ